MRKLALKQLPNTEVSGVGLIIEEEVESSGLVATKEALQFTMMRTDLADYNSSLRRMRKSEKFATKEAAEKALVDAYTGTRHLVVGLTYSPDAATKDKAGKLFGKLNMYGGSLVHLSDTDKSVKINNILVELGKPEYKQLITDLNIKPYIDVLAQRCESFRNEWNIFEHDKEAFRNSQSATISRKKVEKSITAFFEFVTYSARYGVEKREEWAALESAIYSRYLTIRQSFPSNSKKKSAKSDKTDKPQDSTKKDEVKKDEVKSDGTKTDDTKPKTDTPTPKKDETPVTPPSDSKK